MRANIASSQSKRPLDTNLTQQRLPTYPASVTTRHIAVAILAIGIIFLPVGTMLESRAGDLYEHKYTYDKGSSSVCHIEEPNEGLQCEVSITIDQDVDGPLYFYYELTNFYQNHRRYYMSRSIGQLQGERLGKSDVALDCSPLVQNGSLLLNPCGLVANSYFNDVFTLNKAKSVYSGSDPLNFDESDIAIPSDRNELFKQVKGFKSVKLNASTIDDDCSTNGLPDDCQTYIDTSTDQAYQFWYPDDDTTQYLYEQYPQISPIKGVEDEHFIVWMRTDLMPTFRKLYGRIRNKLKKGDVLTFDVTNNFEVHNFHATKSIVLTKLGKYGGKNEFSGQAFIVAGSFCLIFGSFLIFKDLFL